MKHLTVVCLLGAALLCSACGDGGAGATATAVYQRERATLEAYYTQSAELFTAAAGEAEALAVDGTAAVATQAALQASLAALAGDFVTAEAAHATQAAAAGRAVATEQARLEAVQSDLGTAIATLAAQVADVGHRHETLQAYEAREAEWGNMILATATAHIHYLAATAAALQTETTNLALTPAAPVTPTPWLTFVPPPTGTPPVSFGPLYTHPSGRFKILPPSGWTERTEAVDAIWISGDWLSVVHVITDAYGPEARLHRFGVLLRVFTGLDHGFAQYHSYRVTGFNARSDPMTIDLDVVTHNQQPYLARQWFGFCGDVVWIVRVVVPANYPTLLDYLGEHLVATLEVYPTSPDEESARPLPPFAGRS